MTAWTSAGSDLEVPHRADPRSPVVPLLASITPGRTHPDDSGEEEHEEFRQSPQGSIASHRHVS
jgi:hypothetical protein